MWGRKCQLFRLKRGGSIQYGLENEEGDSPIHLSKRYVCISKFLKGHTVMFVSVNVKIRRTGEAGAYRWSIRKCYSDICSPSFEMWGRKCQLFRLKRGGSIQYGLENEEGDSPIHLSKRYVCIQQILKGTHSHVCLC